MDTTTKRCPKCDTDKNRTEFYRCAAKKDGLQVWCKACLDASNRERKYRDPEQWRAEKRQAGRKTRQQLRWEVIESLGGRCAHCGIDDLRVLEIDHIFDDGHLHRKAGMAYHTYLRGIANEVQSGSDRYQALCANCHAIKTWWAA